MGPRQCGKSTFLRSLAFNQDQATYRTLDRAEQRDAAQNAPNLFLSTVEKFPLIIDEAQKVPIIFYEIKAVVDEKRIPGRFILSGRVQFSKEIGIRESLTGRSATIRLDTLTISETISDSEITLKNCSEFLTKGGMPGSCFLRDASMRNQYWEQWLETMLERDLLSYGAGRLSSSLRRDKLLALTTLEHPDINHLLPN